MDQIHGAGTSESISLEDYVGASDKALSLKHSEGQLRTTRERQTGS